MTRKPSLVLPVLAVMLLPHALRAQTATFTGYDYFTTTQETSNIGTQPNSPLVQGLNGQWYGTLLYGGDYTSATCAEAEDGCGAIFSASIPGVATQLYQFTGGTDGDAPDFGLVMGTDGNFYGVTAYGGYEPTSGYCAGVGCGTIFKITPTGTLTTLHSFVGTDGADPAGALVQGSDGNFYGTTFEAGDLSVCPYEVDKKTYDYGCGTLFRYNPTSGVFTTLYFFQGGSDESGPEGVLLQASDGNLYGETLSELGAAVESTDCPTGCGTLFEYNLTTNTFSTLYTFSFADGYLPIGGLVEGQPGIFYGVTEGGGANSLGTVFEYNQSTGTLTTLHSFTDTRPDGEEPQNALFLAGDGNLYGHTLGALQEGNVFTITPNGTYTDLAVTGSGTVYSTRSSSLVQGGNGLFYSSTVGVDGPRDTPNCENTNYCGELYTVAISTNPAPAISLTASSATGAIGTPLTLTWSVTNAISTTLQQCYAYTAAGGGTGWSGQVNFTPVNGAATGTASVTPTAGGTINYAFTCGGSETAVASVTVGATTTTLTATPSSTVGGTPVVLAATVSSALGTPTGAVSFYLGTTLLGASTLDGSGVATYTLSTTTLYEGNYTATAIYSGSTTLAGSTSSSVAITITSSRAQSTTLIGSSGLTVSQGSNLTLSTNVTGIGTSTVPTGTVTFSSLGTTIGTVTLNASGIGTLPVTGVSVPIGPYPVVGSYSGDTNFLPSASAALQVNIVYGTTSDLSAAATGATSVALTTTVTSKGGVVPTGTVTYSVDGTTLGTATLVGGVAKFTGSTAGIAAGSYPVTAAYSGDSKNNASSTTSTIAVLAATKTTLTSSATTVTPPADVTLTATLNRTGASGTPSTGTVTFYAGTEELGTATVSNGVARLTEPTTGVAAGTYMVTAKYGGDALDAASASAGLSIKVE